MNGSINIVMMASSPKYAAFQLKGNTEWTSSYYVMNATVVFQQGNVKIYGITEETEGKVYFYDIPDHPINFTAPFSVTYYSPYFDPYVVNMTSITPNTIVTHTVTFYQIFRL